MTKLRQATLCLLIKDNQVLLAMKKRGFGVGRWNGVGGKLKDGEDLEQALIRETQEEITVTPVAFEKVAILDFYFPEVPQDKDWNQQVVAYLCTKWTGEPTESEEMAPRWFDIDNLPYDQMWPDDSHWMPLVYQGKKVRGTFTFSGDGILDKSDVSEVDKL